MNEWENILNTGDFFRVHKAYIVNMDFINEIGKEILLDNGEKVAVSIRQVGRLKKACKAYRRRNAR
jgi:DNA-binding LytR/AlgR family response regulator